MQTGLWRSELGACVEKGRGRVGGSVMLKLPSAHNDDDINNGLLHQSLFPLEDGNALFGRGRIPFLLAVSLPVAWKCVFHLPLGCALHKCRWNPAAPPSPKWSFNGTVCTGAGKLYGALPPSMRTSPQSIRQAPSPASADDPKTPLERQSELFMYLL